jgi:cob(I)alamin adenosyltransferase
VVSLSQSPGVELSPLIVPYLNRLSDYLFVAARAAATAANTPEVLWEKPTRA